MAFDSLIKKFHKDAKKGDAISAQESSDMIERGEAVLIDVREKEETLTGMAEPALWLPTSDIEEKNENYSAFLSRLPKEKTIIIYCAAGVRAGRFAEELTAHGFQTRNMGGFFSWFNAGLPCKKC